jgi:hypothetical protein
MQNLHGKILLHEINGIKPQGIPIFIIGTGPKIPMQSIGEPSLRAQRS